MPTTAEEKQLQSNYVNFLNNKLKTEKDPEAVEDYKKQLDGATKSLARYDKQTVTGPDGKSYSFSKKISKERIDKYFIKQGWVKKGDSWFTKTGEPAKLGVPSQVPMLTNSGTAKKIKLGNAQNPNIPSIGATGSLTALPAVGGFIGGLVGKTPGAALGGAVGEGAREIGNRILYGSNISNKQEVLNILKEGAIQGGLEYAGQKAGDIFFKLLSKIPHAKIVDGIPMLPSDRDGNSKISKYVEDLLTNLLPSSKTMAEFKAGQTKVIDNKLDLLVKGFSKFKGTTEDMGIQLQNATRAAEKDAKIALQKQAKGLADPKDIVKTKEYKEYIQTFNDRLMRKVATTDSPELIGGYVTSSSFGHQSVRQMVSLVSERSPKTWANVQAKILKDVITDVMTGASDPVAKGAMKGKFVGKNFKDALNSIGEERLKIIYGQDGFDNLEHFAMLTQHTGQTAGSGIGKFMNLIYVLPLRAGISSRGLMHLATGAFITNRAAKIMTSTEGVKMYETYIRATTSQSPRLIKLSMDEIQAFNKRSDDEYEQGHQERLEKFMKENPDYKPQETK